MYEQTMNNDVTLTGGENPLLAGRYRVVRQLGTGGMGSVWLAEDRQLDNKLFAVKMLPSVLVSNKRAYRQLKDEALVAMKLVHPNIVQIRAFEENNGNPFLVMDYIDGQTLDDYLAEVGNGEQKTGNGRARSPSAPQSTYIPEADVVRILSPIAAALDYAHSKGVVHRDVKPGNVMIAKDGTPYILDFGIAREIQETMTRVTGKLSSGTLLYMSPEQLRGQPPKAAQDVYSFAAMVYECLKGEPPFSRGQVEYQILNEQPGRLSNDIRMSASIMRGLSKTPEARPDSCSEVLFSKAAIVQSQSAELQPCIEQKQSAASLAKISPPPQNSKSVSSILFVIIALLVILGGVVFVFQQRWAGRRRAVAPVETRAEYCQSRSTSVVSNPSEQSGGPKGDVLDLSEEKGLVAWQSLQSQYNEEVQKTSKRLQELQKKKSPEDKLVLSAGQQQEIAQFRQKQSEILRRMKEVRQRLEKLNSKKHTVVGVMTSLPEYYIDGVLTNQWTIYKEIQSRYTSRVVPVSAEAIDNDVDVLVLIQPKKLSNQTLYAIDQYVLRGGRVVVCVDPVSVMELIKQRKEPQFTYTDSNSTLEALFDAWGVVFTCDSVVADLSSSTRLATGDGGYEVNPMFLTFGENNIKHNHASTKGIKNLMFPLAGSFSFKANRTNFSCDELIFSSKSDSLLVSSWKVSSGISKPQSASYYPDGISRIIVARLYGTFPTAFPIGNDSGYMSVCPNGISEIVLFGDADFIAQDFCLGKMGDSSGIKAINDNVAFFMHVLESLCENEHTE